MPHQIDGFHSHSESYGRERFPAQPSREVYTASAGDGLPANAYRMSVYVVLLTYFRMFVDALARAPTNQHGRGHYAAICQMPGQWLWFDFPCTKNRALDHFLLFLFHAQHKNTRVQTKRRMVGEVFTPWKPGVEQRALAGDRS